MKEKEPTLKYIAEKLNISITTVSKALKGYKDVNAKTREKVIELAKTLNYTPNSFAVNFRTNESKIIGLIIPEVVHHFFSSVVNGIIAEAEKQDYLVIILQSNESKEMEKRQVELLMNKRVDGIIISLSNLYIDNFTTGFGVCLTNFGIFFNSNNEIFKSNIALISGSLLVLDVKGYCEISNAIIEGSKNSIYASFFLLKDYLTLPLFKRAQRTSPGRIEGWLEYSKYLSAICSLYS